MSAPRVVALDEITPIAGPGTLTWRPVRHALGVRAFGCNAYTAQNAGEDVVEPHVEDAQRAHEELYFVARGLAVFTIDGARHDAPAGTYVFVPDPASHRHAVAGEAGTTVLSFGGPPTFVPSPWEWAFRASGVRDDDPDAAMEILRDGLGVYPDDAHLHYELACLDALQGRRDAALQTLARAVSADPRTRGWARDDDDFAGLRDDPEFVALTKG